MTIFPSFEMSIPTCSATRCANGTACCSRTTAATGLKSADIEKRLTKIDEVINLIKKGKNTAVIGSKIIGKIKEIVESHPSLLRKGSSIDDT